MTYLGPPPASGDTPPATMTAPAILRLAEAALKAGRWRAAARYVSIAYTLFDADIARRTGKTNASGRNSD